MSIEFQLETRPGGFFVTSADEGESVAVVFRELIPPASATLFLERIDQLQRSLFSKIPGLPRPSAIAQLLVLIRPDRSGVAYVNEELRITAVVKPMRAVSAGESVYATDIELIDSVDLGVDVPADAGFVVVRTLDWQRSLFYDFGPLQLPPRQREYSLESALATQQLLLLGLDEDEVQPGARLSQMKAGLYRLSELLNQKCEDEEKYQSLLEEHPWMFGGAYDLVEPHRNLDDRRIPDFTARRSFDGCRDVVEIKQPFLRLFRNDGRLAAAFNDSWNQCEDYLTFVQRQKGYLLEEKELVFENPKCLLLIGSGLEPRQRTRIRHKEGTVRAIECRTYDELFSMASHMVALVEKASKRETVTVG